MTVRVLIADDHDIVREGFRALLGRQADIEVVAEAADGEAAVRLARELDPDVVVMDIAMPRLSGIDATRLIRDELPATRVVALSIHAERHYVQGMLAAGASAYLVKSCAFQELVQAIHAVSGGERYLSPKVAAFVEPNPAQPLLSAREREVVALVAEGLSSKEIASRLSLSVRTVDAHRRNIAAKLGLRNVAELTRYAVREGIAKL